MLKLKTLLLLTIYLLASPVLNAQLDWETKKELREKITFLTTKYAALHDKNLVLEDSIDLFSLNLSVSENKNKTNDVEITRLNNLYLLTQNKITELKNENLKEITNLKEENLYAISKLKLTLQTLKDSISKSQSSSNGVASNDFLNKYYFKQIPLDNVSFSLVLSKLVYGVTKINSNEDYYNNEEELSKGKGEVRDIPEILDVNAFEYGDMFNGSWNKKDLVYFNSLLPKLEITKNKLLTFKYNNRTEESFLLNVKHPGAADNNNQREILQIELANEEVKEDGSNNTAKDIVWRFFVVENECYLALSPGQLNRLGLHCFGTENDYNNSRDFNGNGISLKRKKDPFMVLTEGVLLNEIIFLFKFKYL